MPAPSPEELEQLASESKALDMDNFDPSQHDRGDTVAEDDSDDIQLADEPPAEEEEQEEEQPAAEEEQPAEEEEQPAEEEEQPAEEEEQEEEPAAKADGKRIMIPKSRFDDVNLRRKEAEARVKELEQQLTAGKGDGPAAQTPDLPEALQKYTDDWYSERQKAMAEAIADGKTDDAVGIMAELRAADREVAEAIASQRSTETVTQTDARRAVMEASVMLADLNPALNDLDTDNYDEQAVNRVARYQRVLLQEDETLSPAEALIQAAEELGFQTGAVEEPEAPKVDVKKKEAERRNLGKKLADKDRQPPRSGGGGDKAQDKIDIAVLTPEEFDALPESKKRELRGDHAI